MRLVNLFRLIVTGALALLLPGLVAAQCTIDEPGVNYLVLKGDTLSAISARFLGAAERWPMLQKANRIAQPKRLRPGQSILLPSDLLQGESRSAQLQEARGEVWLSQVASPSAQESKPLSWQRLMPGQNIEPGTVLKVGPLAHALLLMPDQSTVRVSAGSVLKIERLCWSSAGAFLSTRLQLEQGRVETKAAPQPRGSRFEVTTPMAVASVRGTEFGLELAQGQAEPFMLADVGEGRVELKSPRTTMKVQQDQGVRIEQSGEMIGPFELLRAPDLSAIPKSQVSTALLLPVGPVAGAARYRFQVSAATELRPVLMESSDSELPIRLVGLPDGSYHVAVRAEDSRGLPGHTSAMQVQLRTTPAPPLLQKPGSGVKLPGHQIELACLERPGISSYAIQWSTRADFSDANGPVSLLSQCAQTVPVMTTGTWYWRAAALAVVPASTDGQALQGPWSHPVSFDVVDPPQTPSLKAAADEDSDVLTLNLGEHPSEKVLLQVALDSQFERLVHQDTSAKSPVKLRLAPGKTYHLRARTTDKYGFNSPFGPVQRIDMPLNLLSASGGSVKDGSGRPITLRWP